MLGRPITWCPVFMKICAGAWLNCVVCIDLTMAMSSASFAVHGSSSEICAPESPCWRNANGLAEQLGRALDEGEALVLDELLGNGLAVVLRQRRLRIEQIELRRRAGHEQVDHPLGLGRVVQAGERAGHRTTPESSAWAADATAGSSSDASASAAEAEVGLLEEETPGDGVERRLGRWQLGIGSWHCNSP